MNYSKTGGCRGAIPSQKKKTSRRYERDGEAYHSRSVEEHYRRMYFEVLDTVVSSLTNRFDQPGYAVYSYLKALRLKAACRKDYSQEMKQVASVYKDNLDTQLDILQANFDVEESTRTSLTIHNNVKHLKSLSKGAFTWSSL